MLLLLQMQRVVSRSDSLHVRVDDLLIPAVNASLSTTGPLAVLIKTASGFINAISSLLIKPFVDSFKGTCNEMISQLYKSSSNPTN